MSGRRGRGRRRLRLGRFFTTGKRYKVAMETPSFSIRNLSVRTLYNYYIYLNIVGTTPGRGYTCPATDEISRWTGAAIDSTKKSYMASGRGGNVWLDEPQVSECLKSSKLEVVFLRFRLVVHYFRNSSMKIRFFHDTDADLQIGTLATSCLVD